MQSLLSTLLISQPYPFPPHIRHSILTASHLTLTHMTPSQAHGYPYKHTHAQLNQTTPLHSHSLPSHHLGCMPQQPSSLTTLSVTNLTTLSAYGLPISPLLMIYILHVAAQACFITAAKQLMPCVSQTLASTGPQSQYDPSPLGWQLVIHQSHTHTHAHMR